jgi:hypothetical protein
MGKVLSPGLFPFCISEWTDSPPFQFNTASLSSCMRLWWRVKKIRFYGTFGLPDFASTTFYDWELVVERNALTEEALICNPDPGWNIVSTLNLHADSSGFRFSRVYTSSGGYVPSASVFGAFEADSAPEEFGFEYVSIYEPITLRAGTILVDEIQLNEIGIALYSESGTINSEVLEYWSYGGTYDTSTGARL